MYVEVRHLCCVFCRIGEIDVGLEVEGRFASAQNLEIANFWSEIRKAAAFRDR
jgi:hypothetical protein